MPLVSLLRIRAWAPAYLSPCVRLICAGHLRSDRAVSSSSPTCPADGPEGDCFALSSCRSSPVHRGQRPVRFLAALALVATVWQAQAHQLWIEQDAQGATLYFGEFGENLREVSPGLLDKFVRPTAQHLSAQGGRSAQVSKTAHGFGIDARAASGESIVAEEAAYPVFDSLQGDKTMRSIFVPAARYAADFTRLAPRLTLDLVPTGQRGADGIEMQAFFKGQPLARAKVEVVAVFGWAQEHQTDEAGKFSVKLPWQGTYVLELSHRDNTAGTRANGDRYERASYVTSLTLVQPAGLPPLPAPPPAAPSKAN